MNKIGFLIFFSFTLLNLSAQNFSKGQALADLTHLQQKIVEFNPGTLKYTPDFQSRSDSLLKTVEDSLTAFELFYKISAMAALSNEGHYELGTGDDIVHRELYSGKAPFLPFTIRIIEGKIYIWHDVSDKGVFQQGDLLLSINGYSSEALLADLMAVTPTDGVIKSYAHRRISDNFPWFYNFYIDQADQFVIRYKTFDGGEIKSDTLRALIAEERIKNFKNRYNPDPPAEPSMDDFYTLEVNNDKATLTLKSFDFRLVEKYDIKAKKFYKDIFQQLKGSEVKELIIDLRGNTGGRNEFAEDMVPFIMKNNLGHDILIKSTSWKGKTTSEKMPKPDKNAFGGDVYVLIDGYTYSTGGVLARYLKEYANALMFGEESGTRYEAFVAGSKQYAYLPHSKIRIGVPCYLKEFPKSSLQQVKNHGLLPDYEVKPTLKNMVDEQDTTMSFVLNYIDKN